MYNFLGKIKAWHSLVLVMLSLIGTAFGAGIQYQKFDNRLDVLELTSVSLYESALSANPEDRRNWIEWRNHVDNLLTKVDTNQQAVLKRLDRQEEKLDRILERIR